MIRTEARDEAGFTLIELMMALTVMSIAIFGIATVFGSAIQTASADAHRTTAVALASRWNDEMAAAPYANLGFSSLSTVFGNPACDSTSDEVLNVVSPLAPPAPKTDAGVTYTGTRCAMWAPGATPTTDRHYKRTVVVVSWSDPVGVLHSVRQGSAVYSPDGQRPPARTAADPSLLAAAQFPGLACVLGAVTVAPSAVARDASFHLTTTVTLSGPKISGGCSLQVNYSPNSTLPLPPGVVTTPPVVVSAVQPTWSVPLPITDTWDLGSHTLVVQDAGTGSPFAQATVCVFDVGGSC